jgi:hypothetical protein
MNSLISGMVNTSKASQPRFIFSPLQPLRRWISQLQLQSSMQAHRVAQLIPAQCPFERDIIIWGHQIAHIPPLCKLNPLYDELVELRFKALCYLADECGEDISAYI